MLEEDARSVAIGLLSLQLTAFFTSASIAAVAILLGVFGLAIWLIVKGQKRDRSYGNSDHTTDAAGL